MRDLPWAAISERWDSGEKMTTLAREFKISIHALYAGIRRHEERAAGITEQAFIEHGRPATCGFACVRCLWLCPCYRAFQTGTPIAEE